MTYSVALLAVLTGEPRLLSDGKTLSALDKRAVDGPVTVGREGIVTDVQADRTVHGGPDKALMHYAFDHYAAWLAEGVGDPGRLAAPGAFGENLSTLGITEADVHVGDVVRIGTVLAQVAQGRQPCFKLNLLHGRTDMSYSVQTTRRAGWYYRVLEPGTMAAGDRLDLVERPQPAWPLSRAQGVIWNRTFDAAALSALAAVPELADGWRRTLLKRLESHAVESWTARLTGVPDSR